MNGKNTNFPRLLTLILGVIAAFTGGTIDLTEEQTLALAVGVAGLYQLISRYVLHREADDLGVPDPRHFFGTVTAWAAAGNAVIAVIVMLGGLPEAVPLPEWFLSVAQLGAFLLSQDRLLAAKGRLTDAAAREGLRGVAQWRKA